MKQSDQELNEELNLAAELVKVGGIYSHYKNPDYIYKVLSLAVLESTTEVCVIYEPQYGARIPFVRPISNWLDELVVDSQKVKRFTLIDGV